MLKESVLLIPPGRHLAAISQDLTNAGLIVGLRYNVDPAVERAVQWLNREAFDLPILAGDTHSFAESVAATGRITGWSYPDQTRDTPFILHAVLWQGGRAVQLPPLAGGVFAEAISVNSAGRIVGQSSAADGFGHAVMWQAPPQN